MDSTRRLTVVGYASAVAALLSGCTTVPPYCEAIPAIRSAESGAEDPRMLAIAHEYGDYALMALDVYREPPGPAAPRLDGLPLDRQFPQVQRSDEDFRNCDRGEYPTEDLLASQGWVRVRDYSRYSQCEARLGELPDFALELWRRPTRDGDVNTPTEYVIAFKGTSGPGGWASDIPLFWPSDLLIANHFTQARNHTRGILAQLRARLSPDAFRVTAVGHSLGAALALHVAREVGGIHKVVGFNPYIEAALYQKDEASRSDEGDVHVAADDTPAALWKDPPASIHLIRENRDVLGLLTPLRGLAVNPPTQLHCRQVNLSGSSLLFQHRIAPMACKLQAIRARGAEVPVQEARQGGDGDKLP